MKNQFELEVGKAYALALDSTLLLKNAISGETFMGLGRGSSFEVIARCSGKSWPKSKHYERHYFTRVVTYIVETVNFGRGMLQFQYNVIQPILMFVPLNTYSLPV